MKKLNFSTFIEAPVEKVWDTMLGEETYKQWTTPFNPGGGSYYVGDWSKGSKMLFIGPSPKDGKEGGMVSIVRESLPYEYISVEHVGIVNDGKEDMTSEEVKKWTPSFENYTFRRKNNGTEVVVEMDVTPDLEKVLIDAWPVALKNLKELAEK